MSSKAKPKSNQYETPISQNENLISDDKSNDSNYDMNSINYDKLREESKSKSDDNYGVNKHLNQHSLVPMIDIDDEDDVIEYDALYLKVRSELISENVSIGDIEYLETKLDELTDINFDVAIMRILQHKIESAHNGDISNKGIHKTEAPPFAFYDDEDMILPNNKKFKAKLNEMNKKKYTENRIEWKDYIKLKEDDVVDYRNDDGKFVIAKVMEKDGVELVLYTKDGQTVMSNFLNQYPFQRLFKAGAVTARIPHKIRRKSIEIGSQIRLLCDTDFIMDSKWTKMECKVVGRDINDKNNDKNNEIVKQIQIEFNLDDNNKNKTNTLSTFNKQNQKKYRMWVHLDNTQNIDGEENDDDDIDNNNNNNNNNDDDDDEEDGITITRKTDSCCIIL